MMRRLTGSGGAVAVRVGSGVGAGAAHAAQARTSPSNEQADDQRVKEGHLILAHGIRGVPGAGRGVVAGAMLTGEVGSVDEPPRPGHS